MPQILASEKFQELVAILGESHKSMVIVAKCACPKSSRFAGSTTTSKPA
jgi:hypothetical protein